MARKSKKIVILYASAGHGHEKAARAVDAVCRTNPSWDVKLVDVLDLTAMGFGKHYRALYFFLIKKFPGVWGFFYGLTDLSWVYFFVKPLRRINNRFFANKLETFLKNEAPDVVISTHFLGSEATSHLKKTGRIKSSLITVITDYMPHAFWIDSHTDAYAVATSMTKESMKRRGVVEEKIFITGIPIESKFYAQLDKQQAMESLGLKSSLFTVLITSGGAGVGIADDLVKRLSIVEPRIQQLVVCGTNKLLFEDLRERFGQSSSIRLYGFVENINELMAASDVVVGKGGGLTITECLCVGRPMVLFGAVPGQETRNVEQAVKYGAAKAAKSINQAVQFVLNFRQNKQMTNDALAAIENLRQEGSAHKIVKLAMEL